MTERLAKDVMIPISEYATVKENDSLKHALLVLRNSLHSGHRTLAVLNDHGDLTGFVTVRTILNALESLAYKAGPADDSGGSIPFVESWSRFFLKNRLERTAEIKVKNVMRPVFKIFVQEDSSLPEVAKTILKNRVNHIPVLSKEQKVVGIIRAVDILDVVANFLES